MDAVKEKRLNNPNGANQYQLDPRQSMFISYYIDPKSQSYGNAYRSAILAGYEENYAANITSNMPLWLSEKLGSYKSSAMLEKAERNLDEILDLPTMIPAMGAFGPIYEKKTVKEKVKLKNGRTVLRNKVKKVRVMTYAGGLLKLKNDASQFVASTVGRKVYGKDAPTTPVAGSIINMTQIIINQPV